MWLHETVPLGLVAFGCYNSPRPQGRFVPASAWYTGRQAGVPLGVRGSVALEFVHTTRPVPRRRFIRDFKSADCFLYASYKQSA